MNVQKGTSSLLIAALTLTTAACGTGNTGAKDDGKLPASKSAEQKPVELTWYHVPADGPVGDAFQQQYGQLIAKKYPNFSFKVLVNKEENTLANVVVSKTNLDVMLASFASLPAVKDNGLLGDLSDLVKKHNFDLNRIETASLDMMRSLDTGKLVALPLYELRFVLYYNKDLFDKFGVPYPKNGLTWEEMIDVSKRMTRSEGGVTYRGYVGPPSNFINANQYGYDFIGAKTNRAVINSDNWKKIAEKFIPIYTAPGYNAVKEAYGYDLFLKEKSAAMTSAYNSYAATVNANVPNWDAASFPEMGDLKGVASQPYPVVLTVPTTSQHRDEAFQAIAQLLTDEVQQERASKLAFLAPLKNPDVKSAFARDVADWKGKNISAVTAQKGPKTIAYNQYNTSAAAAIGNAMMAVIDGSKDINTALREEEEKLNKQITADEAAKK
ncbi:MAG: extracellular solute-binding protein family 1 [Paenibacillus sp.]|nr:extracellular solute-binding protein family 1 [Paenibacillus sp.]